MILLVLCEKAIAHITFSWAIGAAVCLNGLREAPLNPPPHCVSPSIVGWGRGGGLLEGTAMFSAVSRVPLRKKF